MNETPPSTLGNTPTPSPGEPEDSMARLMNGPSGIVAAAALILGLAALAMFYITVDSSGIARRNILPHSPPSLLAVNLSFFAIMLATAAVYRIRRLPRQGLTRSAAIIALLLGLIGPLIYSLQSLEWRERAKQQEFGNIKGIAEAARNYAVAHAGAYPANLAVLLMEGKLPPEELVSPFTSHHPPAMPAPPAAGAALSPDAVKAVSEASDYEYVGGDLNVSFFDQVVNFDHKAIVFDHKAIVVVATEPRMGDFLTVGFANNDSTFLKLDEVEAVFAANDAVREKVGLAKLVRPAVINPNAATNPTSNP